MRRASIYYTKHVSTIIISGMPFSGPVQFPGKNIDGRIYILNNLKIKHPDAYKISSVFETRT